jgi:hypothetical protein
MNKNAIRRRRRGSGGSLSGILFSASEPGFTFEPWDITTLYQDRAGTTPVTAAGQSVGYRRDKSGRGNHQVAVSDAKRGVYGWMPKTGRRNLLNATDTLSTQSVTVTAVAHTLAFTGTGTVTLSGVSTAGPLVGTGAGNRVTLTFTPTAGSLTLTVSGSVTLAQLQLGSADTAYQRVVSQYDITEAGVPTCYYVQADGVDDAYVTPTITPGTDKAQVFIGATNLSDAAIGLILETSVNGPANNGSISLRTRTGAAPGIQEVSSRGTLNAATNALTATFAPTTNVLTVTADIAADSLSLRRNGIQRGTSSADQGTGNYLDYPAYIYGRGGTSLPFNGLDFGHAVRFGPNLDAATIARVESLIARNTPGVTL